MWAGARSRTPAGYFRSAGDRIHQLIDRIDPAREPLMLAEGVFDALALERACVQANGLHCKQLHALQWRFFPEVDRQWCWQRHGDFEEFGNEFLSRQ
jgi:hypothetical protein